jgi:hypothetical protein
VVVPCYSPVHSSPSPPAPLPPHLLIRFSSFCTARRTAISLLRFQNLASSLQVAHAGARGYATVYMSLVHLDALMYCFDHTVGEPDDMRSRLALCTANVFRCLGHG